MPGFIHHAETGSFKTSGAIQDHAIPAMKAGRVIVTNIRGMSTERCYKVFPDLPESFNLIFIDTDTEEGLSKIRIFFHWVPLGCLLILDETTSCFPKSWRQADIDALDYPGGLDAATAANRPYNWLVAWEKHRHYGWEIVMTTPNIKNVRDDIRGSCNVAFLHAPRSHIGLGGYNEVMHKASENGGKASWKGEPYSKFIKKQTFELYDSTADGEITVARKSRPIYKDPKIVLLVVFAALSLGYGFSSVLGGKVGVFSAAGRIEENRSNTVADSSVPVQKVTSSSSSSVGGHAPSISAYSPDIVDPFNDLKVYIDGHMQLNSTGAPLVFFRLESGSHQPFTQTSNDLRKLGYSMNYISDCFVRLEFENVIRWVHCAKPIEKENQKPEDSFKI